MMKTEGEVAKPHSYGSGARLSAASSVHTLIMAGRDPAILFHAGP